jgi:hypothetical protein
MDFKTKLDDTITMCQVYKDKYDIDTVEYSAWSMLEDIFKSIQNELIDNGLDSAKEMLVGSIALYYRIEAYHKSIISQSSFNQRIDTATLELVNKKLIEIISKHYIA